MTSLLTVHGFNVKVYSFNQVEACSKLRYLSCEYCQSTIVIAFNSPETCQNNIESFGTSQICFANLCTSVQKL